MVYSSILRQRRANWVRLYRLQFFFLFSFFLFFNKIRRLLKNNHNTRTVSAFIFMLFFKKKTNKYHLPKVRIKNRCIFSGSSRGLRFSINRMRLLKLSYYDDLGSFYTSRW